MFWGNFIISRSYSRTGRPTALAIPGASEAVRVWITPISLFAMLFFLVITSDRNLMVMNLNKACFSERTYYTHSVSSCTCAQLHDCEPIIITVNLILEMIIAITIGDTWNIIIYHEYCTIDRLILAPEDTHSQVAYWLSQVSYYYMRNDPHHPLDGVACT